MYKLEIWDYSQDKEKMDILIKKLFKTSRVIVMYDPDFPTGRGVFHFGEESELNLKEAEAVVDGLNNFHYKGGLINGTRVKS